MSSTGSKKKDVSPPLEVAPHPEANGGDESLELTPDELRRLKRIVNWRILPYISLLYLLSVSGGLAQCVLLHSHALARFLDSQVFWTE
jgi:hypothetical protein